MALAVSAATWPASFQARTPRAPKETDGKGRRVEGKASKAKPEETLFQEFRGRQISPIHEIMGGSNSSPFSRVSVPEK